MPDIYKNIIFDIPIFLKYQLRAFVSLKNTFWSSIFQMQFIFLQYIDLYLNLAKRLLIWHLPLLLIFITAYRC